MDQRALEDIGLSRGQVLAEARKPFWSRYAPVLADRFSAGWPEQFQTTKVRTV
jgi:hypothetical protein